VSIPRLTTLPYENIVYFTKTQANQDLRTLNNFQYQSDTLRFTSLPEKIYIMARPQMQARAAASAITATSWPDSFFSVGNTTSGLAGIQVSLGNKTGQLASASTKTIYRMSKKNGYNGSFNEWLLNSLIIIDPVCDLGIDVSAGDILPGETGSINFQINASFNNSNILFSGSTNTAWGVNNMPTEMSVIVVYAGTVSISGDSAVYNTGELSHHEVDALLRTAPKNGTMMSTETFRPTVQAGSLFSKFKSVLGTVANGLKSDSGQKALGIASKYLNGGAMTAGNFGRRA
jgi:hypothetical protein